MKSKAKTVAALNKNASRGLRGGGFFTIALYCRSAFRFWDSAGYVDYGFRLVKPVKKAK